MAIDTSGWLGAFFGVIDLKVNGGPVLTKRNTLNLVGNFRAEDDPELAQTNIIQELPTSGTTTSSGITSLTVDIDTVSPGEVHFINAIVTAKTADALVRASYKISAIVFCGLVDGDIATLDAAPTPVGEGTSNADLSATIEVDGADGYRFALASTLDEELTWSWEYDVQ